MPVVQDFFVGVWILWSLLQIPLLMVGLLVLVPLVVVLVVPAAGAKQARWKIALVLVLGVPVVVIALCAALFVALTYHAPLVNVPAPVPASLSLSFYQFGVPAAVDTLSARTGGLRWHQSFGDNYVDEVQVASEGDAVYGLATTGILALRASDGHLLWRSSPSNFAHLHLRLPVTVPPILANGMLYVSAYDDLSGGAIDALRASDGSLAWSVPLGADHGDYPSSQSQAVPLAGGQNMLFVGSGTGTISAFGSSTGARLWTWHASGGAAYEAIPAFAAGVVYVTGGNEIVALHASDGTLIWSDPLSPRSYSLDIGANSLYFEVPSAVGTIYDELYSVSTQTGQVQWRYPVIDNSNSIAAEAGGLVYIASDRSLDALRVSDGHRVRDHSSNGNVGFGTPIVVNHVLFG